MIISPSNNETSLSEDEYIYLPYNCMPPYCAANLSDTTSISTTDTVCTSGYRANASVQIVGESLWNPTTSVLFLTGTDTGRFDSLGTYDFSGLGSGGNAIHNFKDDHPFFSVFAIADTVGQLIFGPNSSLPDPDIPAVVLPSDHNWQVPVSSVTFGGLIDQEKPLNLAFNMTRGHLNDQPIMLPDSHYSAVITALTEIKGVEASIFDFSYTFTGDLSTLPNLVVGLPDGFNWTLTPELYTTLTADKNTLSYSKILKLSYSQMILTILSLGGTLCGRFTQCLREREIIQQFLFMGMPRWLMTISLIQVTIHGFTFTY